MLRRLLQRKSQARGQEGFTIIEVLIVLAIAGLIMVVVFLAIPNLQKSQRNNARKTDANNTLSALSDYVSNNGGQLPTKNCTGNCSWVPTLGYFSSGNVNYKAAFVVPTKPDTEHMILIAGATCGNGAAGKPTASTSPRGLAVYYGIEGSVATQCISE